MLIRHQLLIGWNLTHGPWKIWSDLSVECNPHLNTQPTENPVPASTVVQMARQVGAVQETTTIRDRARKCLLWPYQPAISIVVRATRNRHRIENSNRFYWQTTYWSESALARTYTRL